MRMNRDSRLGSVFLTRFYKYVRHIGLGTANTFHSPMFELFNTCVTFGIMEQVVGMVVGHIPVMSKKKWSDMIWNKAWSLDDAFWKSTVMLHERNDLLNSTVGKSQYLTWWHIADNLPQTQSICETMARLICHASRLKEDDFRLAGASHSDKTCTECDHNIRESVKHLVMQCPANERLRIEMFNEIYDHVIQFPALVTNNPDQVFHWLMGKEIVGMEPQGMIQVWIIAGYHICKMYNLRVKRREGIG